MDDLCKCLAHRIPVNRCNLCWPNYLTYLGDLCWKAITLSQARRHLGVDTK